MKIMRRSDEEDPAVSPARMPWLTPGQRCRRRRLDQVARPGLRPRTFGVPARVVMEILGHSQIAPTMNTYSHVAREVSREAVDRIAQALWQDAEDQPGDDQDEDQADDEDGEPGEGR